MRRHEARRERKEEKWIRVRERGKEGMVEQNYTLEKVAIPVI